MAARRDPPKAVQPINPGDVAQAAIAASSTSDVAGRLGVTLEDLLDTALSHAGIFNILENAIGAAAGKAAERRATRRWAAAERRTLAAEPAAQVVQVVDVVAFELPHIFASVHPPPGVDLVWSLDTGSCRCYLVSHDQV